MCSARLALLLQRTVAFPWRNTASTLLRRFREERLGLTAGSLTFTTTIALVPLFAVLLAVFAMFPIFARLQDGLQQWLFNSLVPQTIAHQVLNHVTQFAAQASRLGMAGLVVVALMSLLLVLNIDRTLNTIWRVRQRRPLSQRVLVYWALLTLGPLVLAASLSLTSYAFSVSRGLVAAVPGGVQLLFDCLEYGLLALGMSALYRYVPNARVKWSHAWIGGLFASSAIELAKRLLALYMEQIPTYSALYGAFAAVPLLLVWIYTAWLIVLFGAVIVAYLPSLLAGVARRGDSPGWAFQLAIEVLRELAQARRERGRGLELEQLVQRLRVDALQLAMVLQTLRALDWVGLLDEFNPERSRHVLLIDPEHTWLEPLAFALLLDRNEASERFWKQSAVASLHLADVL